MNDTDVIVFEKSTEENIKALKDQKYFQNLIARILLNFKRFINSSCIFLFIKVNTYNETNDT